MLDARCRTTTDDTTTPDDVVRCRATTFTCKLPCRAGVGRMMLRRRATYTLTQKLNLVQFLRQSRYDIVRYVNSAVKSMCSISATPDDIVRRRPISYDVVRSVNTA